MAESATGEVRYLLSDGLGSVRQATDESGDVVAYNEFDPYGNSVQGGGSPYGFTGEWWESDISLLYLRARWSMPETGTFLSIDPVEGEPPYQYGRGNPVNRIDRSGYQYGPYAPECFSIRPGDISPLGCAPPPCLQTYLNRVGDLDIAPIGCPRYPTPAPYDPQCYGAHAILIW